jgi:hypothetical protein
MNMDSILDPLLALLVIALPLWLAYVLLRLDARLDGWFRLKQAQTARSHLPKGKGKANDA